MHCLLSHSNKNLLKNTHVFKMIVGEVKFSRPQKK